MDRKKTPSQKNSTRKLTDGGGKAKGMGAVSPEVEEHFEGGRSWFPMVGIGASAGGLEALVEFFKSVPADTGMGYVVVTHQHPGHTSLLPDILGKSAAMPVVQVVDGMKVEPDHVYIGAPEGSLAILNGVLHHIAELERDVPHLSIDFFFRSLAEDLKERAIGIILSGTGSDGTLGVKAIKAVSGMAMAQLPQSAKYAGMPSSAIATGLVDYVLAPAEMPEQLIAYVRGPYLAEVAESEESRMVPLEPIQKIFVLLRSHTGHDFSCYKLNTIRRRIERRMNVHQIEHPDQYVRYLQENPNELDVLFKELLISVTHFFRDPEAWVSLLSRLEELVKARPENDALRAWVPGCATGEEAFSLAILIREAMNRAKRIHDVQIFGTDLDPEAIESARSGRYPDGIAGDVSSEYLEKFFLADDGGYRIRKEIREMVIFAQQNVIKDPPFTKLDLISCRNLLIYLNADLQRRLLPIFHYALKPGGLLLLGPSETIGTFTDLFEPLDKRWKIFRRKEVLSKEHALPEIPAQYVPADKDRGRSKVKAVSYRGRNRSDLIERLLLKQFVPASVVVNAEGEIIYIHGRTGDYLEPAQGAPSNNLLEMARAGLQIELSGALRECLRTGEKITRNNVQIRTNGDAHLIELSVVRLQEPGAAEVLFLVSFRSSGEGLGPVEKKRPARRKKADKNLVARLEDELQHLRESHQTTLEELETSNEELKSANEELQSTNEELQSTNEELETSKEELQSLNEELTTVNAELQSKVDELSQSNDDMQNLLNSTDIATIFLDRNLNIKRFTDQAKELVMMRTSDLDRPLSELVSSIETTDLAADCREVLRTLVPREAEVGTSQGGCYLMQIIPYRTAENTIDGLVLTFVNMARVKAAEDAGERARAYFESIVDTVREPLMVLDEELRVVSANRSYYRVFRSTPRQTEGEMIYELGTGLWDLPSLRTLLDDLIGKEGQLEDYEVEVEIPRVGRRVFLLNARRIEQSIGQRRLILLAFEDMTTMVKKKQEGEQVDG